LFLQGGATFLLFQGQTSFPFFESHSTLLFFCQLFIPLTGQFLLKLLSFLGGLLLSLFFFKVECS
jgi:hypothetical protein